MCYYLCKSRTCNGAARCCCCGGDDYEDDGGDCGDYESSFAPQRGLALVRVYLSNLFIGDSEVRIDLHHRRHYHDVIGNDLIHHPYHSAI